MICRPTCCFRTKKPQGKRSKKGGKRVVSKPELSTSDESSDEDHAEKLVIANERYCQNIHFCSCFTISIMFNFMR